MKLRCFDHETTGIDIETCNVVQSAVVDAPFVDERIDLAAAKCHERLFYAKEIPAGATAVHGLVVDIAKTPASTLRMLEDKGVTPQEVKDAKPFEGSVVKFVRSLIAPGVVTLSYNGTGYDIPLTARIAEQAGMGPRQRIEQKIRRSHIDMMRVWLRLKQDAELEPPWQAHTRSIMAEADPDGQEIAPSLTAAMFGGSLTACHGFFLGRGFEGAHDAGDDCRATLAVLDVVLSEGLDIETLIEWSNEPLPGDVDFSGKLKWDENGRAVMGFGKHRGSPLRDVPRSFFTWMLGKDFPDDTKQIVRAAMAGRYPTKRD